jgi:hypothetical protein
MTYSTIFNVILLLCVHPREADPLSRRLPDQDFSICYQMLV